MTVDEIEKDTIIQLEKILETYTEQIKKIQIGRVDPSLFENVPVTENNNRTVLKTIAQLSMIDNDTLAIKPYIDSSMGEIQKALNNAKRDLTIKFNILQDKKRILLKFELTITQELRRNTVTICDRKTEEFKIAIRNLRHDILKKLKDIIKNEEEFKKSSKKIQIYFDKANKQLEDKNKEKSQILMGA